MSKYNYFSNYDNSQGEYLTVDNWKAIKSGFDEFLDSNYFAEKFPEKSWKGITGTDSKKLLIRIQSKVLQVISIKELFQITKVETGKLVDDIYGISNEEQIPETKDMYELVPIMDFIHTIYHLLSKPITNKGNDNRYDNTYFTFNENSKLEAQKEFREELNDTFKQQELNFVLQEDGKIIRRDSPLFEKQCSIKFNKDDSELNKILNSAYTKFKSVDVSEKKIAVEKLWDAFNHIKSYEIPEPKKTKQSIDKLLNNLFQNKPKLKDFVNTEMSALSKLGNNDLNIRHSEVYLELLNDSNHIDYLFYRMSATIHLLLTGLNRK